MALTGRKDMESWENAVQGIIVLKRFDHRGEMTRDEPVYGGRIIHLSPEERRVNEEMAATPEQNVFRNGMMRPIRLLDGDEEATELASNPNVMAEDDMAKLLKSHHKTFASKLEEIKNPYALQRLLKVAENPEVDATVSKVAAIKAKLAEISPEMALETQAQTVVAPNAGMRAVTPR